MEKFLYHMLVREGVSSIEDVKWSFFDDMSILCFWVIDWSVQFNELNCCYLLLFYSQFIKMVILKGFLCWISIEIWTALLTWCSFVFVVFFFPSFGVVIIMPSFYFLPDGFLFPNVNWIWIRDLTNVCVSFMWWL